MAELGHRADGCCQLGPIPSHPIPSHPIPSHPIPSHPIPWGHGRDRTEEGPGTHPTALCSIPWGIQGLSLPGEHRAGLCSPASPAAPQLWLGSLFARCSHGPDTRTGSCPWPRPQSTEGTCSHPHLGWACCHCSAQHSTWSTPWNLPLLPVLCSPADVPQVCVHST